MERNGYSGNDDYNDNRSMWEQDRGHRRERGTLYGSEYNERRGGQDDRSFGRDWDDRSGFGGGRGNEYGGGYGGGYGRGNTGGGYGRSFGGQGYSSQSYGGSGFGSSQQGSPQWSGGGIGHRLQERFSERQGHWGGGHGMQGGGSRYNVDAFENEGSRYGHQGSFGGQERGWFGGGSERGGYSGGMGGSYGGSGDTYGGGYGSTGFEGSERGFGGGRMSRMMGKAPKGFTRSDDRIRELVCERLAEHIDASEITVDVKEAVVTLTGTVDSRNTKYQAEELSEQVLGVKDVDNRVRVKKGFLSSLFGTEEEGSSASSEQRAQTGQGGRTGSRSDTSRSSSR